MRRPWRILLLVLPLLLTACSSDAPPPEERDALTLTGRVTNWGELGESGLHAVATPYDRERIVSGSGAVQSDGSFTLPLPRPHDDLLRAAGDIYPPTPECTGEGTSDPTARLLLVAGYPLREAPGTLTHTTDPAAHDATTVTHLYAASPLTVHRRCVYDGQSFSAALDLRAGWNTVRIDATSVAYDIVTGAPPADAAWYHLPEAGENRVLRAIRGLRGRP